jgi:hypothetical protein
MYCPNCGAQNKKKQNFCRYCGLHLHDIEKTFLNQLVFGVETKRLKNLRNARKITDYAQVFSVFMLVIGILALIFSGSNIGKVLLSASLLSFFLGQAAREIFGYLQRQKSGENAEPNISDAATQREFQTMETNKLIEEKPFVSASSVTERETELLYADRNSGGLK